jgi:hypothetical protein
MLPHKSITKKTLNPHSTKNTTLVVMMGVGTGTTIARHSNTKFSIAKEKMPKAPIANLPYNFS